MESWIDECLASVVEQCARDARKDAVRLVNDRLYEAQIGYFHTELLESWANAVDSYNGKVDQPLQYQTLPHGEFSVRRPDSPSTHLLIVMDRAARLILCTYSYPVFRGQIEREQKKFFVSVADDYLFLRQERGRSIMNEDAAKEIFVPFFMRAPFCP